MYVPPHFAETDPEVLRALIRAHPLGTWVVPADGTLVVNHIPFVDRLVGWWSRMRADGWLKTATREQRAALKRDLQPIVNIHAEL